MFYEDRVTSFPDLARRLRVLDQDAGVRLVGGPGRGKVLAFVTRSGPKYTMMTYAMGKAGTPTKRLQTIELGGFDSLEVALRKFVKGGLRAWVY